MFFNSYVMSDSLWHHELEHARLPFLSLSPGVCSNSCPFSQWCHQTISSSVTFFSSWLQSFPALGSSPMSWLFFTISGQSTGASALAAVLPMNIQSWFSLGFMLHHPRLPQDGRTFFVAISDGCRLFCYGCFLCTSLIILKVSITSTNLSFGEKHLTFFLRLCLFIFQA